MKTFAVNTIVARCTMTMLCILVASLQVLFAQTPRIQITDSARIEILNTGSSIYIGRHAGALDQLIQGGVHHRNIGIGDSTLRRSSTGIWNIAIGHQALEEGYTMSGSSATANVAIGTFSLRGALTGFYNTAVGHVALANLEGPSQANTAIGAESLLNLASGSFNTSIGAYALNKLTSGSRNIALGQSALYNLLNGGHNVAIGSNAQFSDTSGAYSVAVGFHAMRGASGKDHVVAVGDSALASNGQGADNALQGFRNVAVGSRALAYNTLGAANTAIGWQAAYHNTTGSANTVLGAFAMTANTTGHSNTAIGTQALTTNDDGDHNTAIGNGALFSNTEGNFNTALGSESLYVNTEGISNVALGNFALYSNVSGSYNTAVGISALGNNTTGTNNTVVGRDAYGYALAGGDNTILGSQTGMKDTLRSSNVYVGHGIDGLQGNANVVVGTHAGAGAVGSANVIIGSQAGANLTGSNRLVIENGSSLDPLIYGEFDNAVLGFHADVGIGTSAPSEALHVAEGNALLDRGTSTGSLTRSLRINGARSLAGTDYAQIQFSNYDENSSASDIVRAMISSTNANGTGNGDLRLHTYDGTLTERMRIEGGGNVGFGNINPSHPLEMASGAHVTAAGVWTNASDISRKKNIRPQPYGLEEVLKMRPTSYEYRADGTTSIGFIAQDIEQIIPEVVSGEDGNKGIAYGLLVSTLVHAVQEQQVMIEQLQQEISRMRQQATGTRLTSNK